MAVSLLGLSFWVLSGTMTNCDFRLFWACAVNEDGRNNSIDELDNSLHCASVLGRSVNEVFGICLGELLTEDGSIATHDFTAETM